MQFPVLIGDIGGTNARFGILKDADAKLDFVQILPVNNHETVERALDTYLTSLKLEPVQAFILAVAAAREGDEYRLTNGNWRFNSTQLLNGYNLQTVVIMNDFSAQALATLAMGPDDLIGLGGGSIIEGMPKLIVGPGTGLGVANLIKSDGKWIILPGEGGHMDLGPRSEDEQTIWQHLERRGGRISGECILSGSGLENLYQAVAKSRNSTPLQLKAPEITASAARGENPSAVRSIGLFVEILGRVAGDLALVTLPKGGVYLAGGIVTKLLEPLATGAFRQAFEDKAPHGKIMKSLPVKLINHPTAALEGLSLFARSPEQYSLEQAVIVHR